MVTIELRRFTWLQNHVRPAWNGRTAVRRPGSRQRGCVLVTSVVAEALQLHPMLERLLIRSVDQYVGVFHLHEAVGEAVGEVGVMWDGGVGWWGGMVGWGGVGGAGVFVMNERTGCSCVRRCRRRTSARTALNRRCQEGLLTRVMPSTITSEH